jgi:microcystin-dependent protein
MPTLDIPKPYDDGQDLTEAMLDQCFESVETFVNTTKLDGDNIAAASISSSHLAAGAVDTSALAANAVTLAKLAAEITAKLVPSGSVLPYGGASAPSGYLLCDGSAVSRTTYSALYGVIGVKHGSGDGATTFNLPDYRGRFLRGYDNGAGRDPDASSRTAMNSGGNTGDNIGSVQGDATALPNTTFTTDNPGDHTHGSDYPKGVQGVVVGGGSGNNVQGNGVAGGIYNAGNHTHSVTGGGDNETRPTNATVNFIIKT